MDNNFKGSIQEIIYAIVEQYNELARYTYELSQLDPDYVMKVTLETFQHSSDIESLLEDDFGRGIILGRANVFHTIENESEEIENALIDDEYEAN